MPDTLERIRETQVRRRLLTPEQAREARLSMETAGAVARRFGVGERLVASVREGRSYGQLQPDEKAAAAQRRGGTQEAVSLPHTELVIGPQLVHPDMADQDRQEAMDAAYECAHGRLPHDSTPACGCWPQEKTNPNPRRNNGDNHRHRERVERFAAQLADTRDNGRVVAEDRPAVTRRAA